MFSYRIEKELAAALAKINAAFDQNSDFNKERRSQEAAFIGPMAGHEGKKQIAANIKARRDSEWDAGRVERESSRIERERRNTEYSIYLEQLRNGTSYERACYDGFILDMKDSWSAEDYAESDRIAARKRAAAKNLEVSA